VPLGFFFAIATLIITLLRLPKGEEKVAFLKITRRQNFIFFVMLFGGLASGFTSISCVRIIYVVRAANHIEQLQRVVAPFIDKEQRLSFGSRTAQISSRGDYEKIITELSSIAGKNHARVPTFDLY
jgi:hypothetical protein